MQWPKGQAKKKYLNEDIDLNQKQENYQELEPIQEQNQEKTKEAHLSQQLLQELEHQKTWKGYLNKKI